MHGKDFTDIVVAFIILIISASDFYKGILMVFTNQTPLLFTVQFGFWILKLLPKSIRDIRYQKAMSVYIKRRKLYGMFALAGGFVMMLLSASIFLNA